MSCNCAKPSRTPLWTAIPEFHQPTEILPGENIDCYAKRAGTNGKNDVAEKPENKIDNMAVTSDLNGHVNEKFKLTPASQRTPISWELKVDGAAWSAGPPSSIPDLTFNSSTGTLSGQVDNAHLGKTYKLMVIAKDGDGEIDSREFNFTPKQGTKDDQVKFIFPLPGGKVTCSFGPRKPPAAGASSMHKGIDCAMPDHSRGNIVAAGDGTVIKCGPASGFGNWIMIEHRNATGKLIATSVYGHMNNGDIYVSVGQKVAAGQKIAKEGNAGIGSGAHLHFEMHKGSWGNPVDPLPYLNGEIPVANNNLPGQDGVPDPAAGNTTNNNTNAGMTSSETPAQDCPDVLPNQAPPTSPSNPEPSTTPDVSAPTQETADVKSEIERALNEDPSLTAEDKKMLLFQAKIESNFKANAKNSHSSARGVFQMLDKTAVAYYSKAGIPATDANRDDPYKATKAQIVFYKEQKSYWDGFTSSGGQRIAGQQLSPEVQTRYASLTQGEFMYGLIHHDGVGNAIVGKDLQGVDYYRKKIREA